MTLDKPDRARQVEKSFSKTHANLSACTPGRTRFHGWQFRWGGQEAQGSESEEEHDLQVLNRRFTVLASDNTSRLASPCRGDFSSPSQTIKFKQNSGVTTERREELLQRPLSSGRRVPAGPLPSRCVLCSLDFPREQSIAISLHFPLPLGLSNMLMVCGPSLGSLPN